MVGLEHILTQIQLLRADSSGRCNTLKIVGCFLDVDKSPYALTLADDAAIGKAELEASYSKDVSPIKTSIAVYEVNRRI